MTKTTKQTVTSEVWDAAAGAWRTVTSEIDVLTPEAAAEQKAQDDAEFLASCSDEELLEAQLFLSLARTTQPS